MTEGLRESVSALMDDEAGELETRRVLSEIRKDDELRNTWKRYHLVSLAIKGQLGEAPRLDVSKGVAQAIADEHPEMGAAGMRRTSWPRVLRAATGVAVAASVAFLAVFGALQFNQPDGGNGPSTVAQQHNDVSDAMLAGNMGDAGDVMTVSSQALSSDQKRLLELINTHTQQANMSRSRGFIPYAQLVSQETIRQR